MEGVVEQFERAKLFLAEARNSRDKVDRFRRLVVSIYFARAVVELMLEAADKQEVKKDRAELEAFLTKTLPYYLLLEKLRIHDFHRFGLLDRPGTTTIQGPMKLKTGSKKGGFAAISIAVQGIEKTTSEGAQVVEQRALNLRGDHVFDEGEGQYVSIEHVLSHYLDAVPDAIRELRTLKGS